MLHLNGLARRNAITSQRSSHVFAFSSLRSRIILLAVFTGILLAGAAASLYLYLESSQTAKIDAAQRHLLVLANGMKTDYASGLVKGGLSLTRAVPSPPRPPPDGPPPPPYRKPAAPSQDDFNDDPLAAVTSTVLLREPDIEGGFYSATADSLVGYAFPTHEGPGGRSEIPGKERPEIEAVARKATSTGEPQSQSFHGAHDAILFVAVPVRDGSAVTGSAWLMQRMPGLEAGRSKQLLWGSLGFGAAALTCALLTFFITSEVSSGVRVVLARLGALEGSLGEHPDDVSGRQLAEFEQVLARVDALSNSLKQKIENERALENEIRHKQRLSALGQFAAGVAHELRNPLATIRLRTQMSKRNTEPASIARNSEVVLDEITRLDSMIERLLYFARPVHLQVHPTSLKNLCGEIFEAWSERFAAAGVRATCDIPQELTAVCDRSKIRQVLENLIENGLQSIAQTDQMDGCILIHGLLQHHTAQLKVEDNGAGLNEVDAVRAMEPFFTTKDTGTGLGLSISYEIVQAHGGDLNLERGLDGGAIATLSLPAISGLTASAQHQQEEVTL